MSKSGETAAGHVVKRRIKQADRMVMIARTAAELFAEKGFHETGTRDLAKATGVSEALLFRYFPTKETLWKAALEACRENAVAASLRTLPNDPASTASLVKLTVTAANSFLSEDRSPGSINRDVINRMILRSLAGDGRFADMVRKDLLHVLSIYIASCLRAAKAAGDIDLGQDDDADILARAYVTPMFMAGVWHLNDINLQDTPDKAKTLIQQTVRSQLRSIGMSNAVIDRELRSLAQEPNS
jgi:AcrR family transcriptional regulator